MRSSERWSVTGVYLWIMWNHESVNYLFQHDVPQGNGIRLLTIWFNTLVFIVVCVFRVCCSVEDFPLWVCVCVWSGPANEVWGVKRGILPQGLYTSLMAIIKVKGWDIQRPRERDTQSKRNRPKKPWSEMETERAVEEKKLEVFFFFFCCMHVRVWPLPSILFSYLSKGERCKVPRTETNLFLTSLDTSLCLAI